jgi:hypothetical protein
VGYIDAKSGRTLVFANLINNIPLTAALPEVEDVRDRRGTSSAILGVDDQTVTSSAISWRSRVLAAMSRA